VARRVAFLQHSPSDVPGLLGLRAGTLGFATAAYRADRGPHALPRAGSFDMLVVMGSASSTTDETSGWIREERRLVAAAVDDGVPVLGVCFGGQLLAQVLGAEVRRLPAPEVGWFPVETDDPDRVPPGPWLLWHEDEFTAPPGAEVVARTEVSLQAFVHGRHTGIQFHPEVTRDVVGRWVLEARDEGSIDPVRAARVMDGFGPRDQGRRHEADRLFDRFAEQAGTAPEKGPGP
jgi:GMP synthase-like glutamine amidotransferase